MESKPAVSVVVTSEGKIIITGLAVEQEDQLELLLEEKYGDKLWSRVTPPAAFEVRVKGISIKKIKRIVDDFLAGCSAGKDHV